MVAKPKLHSVKPSHRTITGSTTKVKRSGRKPVFKEFINQLSYLNSLKKTDPDNANLYQEAIKKMIANSQNATE